MKLELGTGVVTARNDSGALVMVMKTENFMDLLADKDAIFRVLWDIAIANPDLNHPALEVVKCAG